MCFCTFENVKKCVYCPAKMGFFFRILTHCVLVDWWPSSNDIFNSLRSFGIKMLNFGENILSADVCAYYLELNSPDEDYDSNSRTKQLLLSRCHTGYFDKNFAS